MTPETIVEKILPEKKEIQGINMMYMMPHDVGYNQARKELLDTYGKEWVGVKILIDLILELKYWSGQTSKHEGRCEYTDKVDEGCCLCQELDNERFKITEQITKDAESILKGLRGK